MGLSVSWRSSVVQWVGVLVAVVCVAVVAQAAAQGRRVAFEPSTSVVVTEHRAGRMDVPTKPGGTPPNRPLVVSGTLRNTGASEAFLPRVVVTLVDGSGNAIGAARGYPAASRLGPGEEAEFRVPTFDDPRMVRYAVVAEEARSAG